MTDKQVVLIGAGDAGIAALIAKHLKVGDEIVCIVEPAKVIRINRGCIAPPIKRLLVSHGHYRQFEKRDKRKNFRR